MKSRSIIYLHNRSGNRLKRKTVTESIEDIKTMSEEEQLTAVSRAGWIIEFIPNPSKQVQLAAVKQRGYSIKYIKNPSLEVQLAAVEKNGHAIQYITNPSEQVQLAAVRGDAWSIIYIKNPSLQVQLDAIHKDAILIKHIKNPSLEAQIEAIKNHGFLINSIDNLSPELISNMDVRKSVIKELLLRLKSGQSIEYTLNHLDEHRADWPELEKIRAVMKKTTITESKKSKEELEEEIMSYMKSKDYELIIVNRSNMIFSKLFYHSGKVGIDSEITSIYRGNQNFDFTVTAKILINGNVHREPSDIVFNSPESAIAYLEKTLGKNIVNQYSSDIYPVITRELESPESMITALLDLTELSKLDNQSVRLFYEDNKPLILNTMKKGLLYSSRFNIEYVIKFLKSTGITWPELSIEYFHKQINTPEVRKEAVSKILIALQGDRMKQAERIVMKLRRLNLAWPELDIIERILYRKPIT
jgi:hypothetical protein